MRLVALMVSGSGPWMSEDHAAGLLRLSRIWARRASVDSFELGPLSQVILRALRPWIAAHVEFATTATPPAEKALSPRAGISKTLRTPRTALARVESKLAGLPPKVGQRAMTA